MYRLQASVFQITFARAHWRGRESSFQCRPIHASKHCLVELHDQQPSSDKNLEIRPNLGSYSEPHVDPQALLFATRRAWPIRQVYLQAAALELWRSSGDHSGVDSIAGIWISSDDSSVLEEVQGVAASYFPNVDVEKIISISFRIPTPGKHNGGDELPTTSTQMVSPKFGAQMP